MSRILFLYLPSVWSSNRHHLDREASSSSVASSTGPLTNHSSGDLQLPALWLDSLDSLEEKKEDSQTVIKMKEWQCMCGIIALLHGCAADSGLNQWNSWYIWTCFFFYPQKNLSYLKSIIARWGLLSLVRCVRVHNENANQYLCHVHQNKCIIFEDLFTTTQKFPAAQ